MAETMPYWRRHSSMEFSREGFVGRVNDASRYGQWRGLFGVAGATCCRLHMDYFLVSSVPAVIRDDYSAKSSQKVRIQHTQSAPASFATMNRRPP